MSPDFDSSFPAPTLPGSVPYSGGPYLASKAKAEFWRDYSYATESARIKSSINSSYNAEKEIIESKMIPLGPKYTGECIAPDLRVMGLR